MFFYRILALDKLGTVFNETVTPLRYTPRKFVIHPTVGVMVAVETDHNAYTLEGKIARKDQMATVSGYNSIRHLPFPMRFRPEQWLLFIEVVQN